MTLPNFLIIGPPKCATSSLHVYLSEHPEIFMPEEKEPWYFSLSEDVKYPSALKINYFSKNITTTFQEYTNLFKEVNHTHKAIGEASTVYFHTEGAAERIKKDIPDVKIIAILRNPADRAYSHFAFNVSRGIEDTQDFSKALQLESKGVKLGGKSSFDFNFRKYKEIGFYYKHLKKYYELFDESNIKIVLYDDLILNPLTVLKDIFEFLNVNKDFVPYSLNIKFNVTTKEVPKIDKFDRFIRYDNPIRLFLKRFNFIYKSLYSIYDRLFISELPPISPEIRIALLKEYKEDILCLSKLIKKDISCWLNKTNS